jgi:hypothetical protein
LKIHTREATDSTIMGGVVFDEDRDRRKQRGKTKNEDSHDERTWSQYEHDSEARVLNTRNRKIGYSEGIENDQYRVGS